MNKIFQDETSMNVELSVDLLNRIFEFSTKCYPDETGGILVGEYSTDLNSAHIKYISGETTDSKRGRTWFYRGTQGLQKWLEKLWQEEGLYYLGEWHSHPKGMAYPSITDIHQMKRISKSKKYKCPEPILFIIGGGLQLWDTKAFLFHNENKIIELKTVN